MMKKAKKGGRNVTLEQIREEIEEEKAKRDALAKEKAKEEVPEEKSGPKLSARTLARKRSKQKKMDTKYRDQDDAERREQMRLLGHSEDVIAAALGSASDSEDGSNGKDSVSDDGEGSDGLLMDETATIVTDLRRGVTDEERAALAAQREAEAKQELAATSSVMATLLPNPVDNDLIAGEIPEDGAEVGPHVLQYPLAMCGPWSAFSKFKYKVKLVPGDLKKGKAARAAVHMFLEQSKTAPGQTELLKAMSDQDLIPPILGHVAVLSPHQNKRGKGKGKGKGGRGKGGKGKGGKGKGGGGKKGKGGGGKKKK